MRRLALVVLNLLFVACAHHQEAAENSLGAGKFADVNYYSRANTYFMPQPTLAALNAAQAQGVTAIINLRLPREDRALPVNVEKEAAKLKMTYYRFPIDPKEAIEVGTLAKIEDAFMAHHKKGEKVIVYCASGQRAAGWFAYHLRRTHKAKLAEAMKEAAEVGLTDPAMTEKVKSAIQ